MPENDAGRAAAIAAATALGSTMTNLSTDIRDLRAESRKSKRLIRLLGVSVGFDLLLSVALGAIGATAHQASDRATEAAAATATAQYETCLAGNESRKGQRELWGYILQLSSQGDASQTEAGRQRLEDFRAYVERVFAPRDCEAAKARQVR